jgi:nitroreductase
METWDAIASRRNVREFADRPLDEQDLHRILEAGRRAASAKNRQWWDFVVLTEPARLTELAKVWQGAAHVADAAAAVCLVQPEVEPEKEASAAFDLGQVAATMQIAAADLGIGSGHANVGDRDLARELLDLPADRVPIRILDFGYPADRPLKPMKNPDRRPFDEVVHWDAW